MWDDLGEYISKLCDENDKDITKVVEVGVGKFQGVSNYLIFYITLYKTIIYYLLIFLN